MRPRCTSLYEILPVRRPPVAATIVTAWRAGIRAGDTRLARPLRNSRPAISFRDSAGAYGAVPASEYNSGCRARGARVRERSSVTRPEAELRRHAFPVSGCDCCDPGLRASLRPSLPIRRCPRSRCYESMDFEPRRPRPRAEDGALSRLRGRVAFWRALFGERVLTPLLAVPAGRDVPGRVAVEL